MTGIARFQPPDVTVVECNRQEGRIRATYRFAEDAPFFRGHFPDLPLVPGILLLDGVVSAARRLLDGVPGAAGLRTRAVEKTRFSRPVRPGETVEYRVSVSPSGTGVFTVKGSVFVGDERCSTCSLVLSSGGPNDFA